MKFDSIFSHDFLTKNEKKLSVLLFFLNLVSLVTIAALASRWSTDDQPLYMKLADALKQGVFGLETAAGFEPEGVRSFGYPLFLLFCSTIFGRNDFGIVFVQSILYLASLFFVWRLVKQNFGAGVSLVFLLLTSVYPFVAYQTCQAMPEAPCVFLLAAAAYVVDFSIRRNRALAGFAVAGMLLAAGVYFRSNLLPLPFFLAALFFVLLPNLRKPALLMIFAAILTVLPASVYNYRNFKVVSPTPVYGGAAISLWMATWHARLGTDAILRYRRQIEISQEVKSSGMFEQIAAANRQIGVPETMFPINMGFYRDNATRAKVQEEYGRLAGENIAETPFVFLKSSAINVFRMWFPYNVGYENFPRIFQFYLLFSGLVTFLLGFAGLLLAFKNAAFRFSPFVVFAAGTMILHSITLCWTHTEARYTIPARLFLVAFAAFAVVQLLKSGRKLLSRRDVVK